MSPGQAEEDLQKRVAVHGSVTITSASNAP